MSNSVNHIVKVGEVSLPPFAGFLAEALSLASDVLIIVLSLITLVNPT